MRTTFNALMYSLALLLVIPPSKASAQVQFVKGAVGVIVDAQTGQEVGTGFSAENTSQVITCAHVIDPQRQYLYVPTGGSSVNTNLTSVLIRVAVALPRHDLIIMAAQTNFCTEPLHFGDFGKFRPGDRIIYLGLRNDKHVMQADTATVGAVGAAANEGTIVDFIEFAGVGVPGYSGGPVFDEKGKVVAVMREALDK